MRNIMKRIALLSATLLIAALPVMAEEAVNPFIEPAFEHDKDQCLIVAANPCDRVGTVQGKITGIERELKKGTDVYTADELRLLREKLDDANRDMIDAYGGGS